MNLETLTSEELAEKVKTGCDDAFEVLFDRHYARLHRFICGFTGNTHESDDLLQDTFIKAYKNIDSYNDNYKFTSWIFTIAKRTALNHLRRVKQTTAVEDYHSVDEETPLSILEQEERKKRIWEIAKGLKPKQFEALWWRYAEGMTIEETAKVMKTNPLHVRVLLHRARNGLSEKLLAQGNELNLNLTINPALML
ncbi:MAG: sigma-70 family RNA polymerase sigma factor [Verrucomicrobia bacterium]|nr:sigma-70 family RNA polymerase sigma factor [Verrucomicrobiota bacterium]MCF7708290.1 sigma-70 family RNA polymerase sigma factor [Verrucomicrobiota bacterium]